MNDLRGYSDGSAGAELCSLNVANAPDIQRRQRTNVAKPTIADKRLGAQNLAIALERTQGDQGGNLPQTACNELGLRPSGVAIWMLLRLQPGTFNGLSATPRRIDLQPGFFILGAQSSTCKKTSWP
jgi:hypothetical protein